MEEPGFPLERSFKRRLMEAQATTVNGGVGNEVGGQVRKVHIIYYLCRNGRVEHPHLIRIHHHSRSGVHLRDVKRWLVELRGKDMPESFAWSFKRRYKKKYVWQDLLNDDLITPICDNEYVLKGSEIYSTTLNNGHPSGPATSIGTQSPQQLEALQEMKAQRGFQPMPDTTPQAFIGDHLPHDHNNNNNNHKRSHFSWASSQNTVYGSCKQCGIGHIPSDCPNRDPSTFRANPTANFAYTCYNLADNKSYVGTTKYPYTGANSHVTQDLSPLDNLEAYYDINSYEGKEVFELKTSPPFEASMRKEYSLDFSTNTSTEIEESSFGSNVTTEDTTKNLDGDKDKEVIQGRDDTNENNSFHETLLNDNMDDDENNIIKSKKGGDKSEISYLNTVQPPNYSYRKSGQKSGMFLNWITCGTASTHEKAVVAINKRNCSIPSTVSSVSEKRGNEKNTGQICKEQKLRDFEKRFDTNDRSKKSKKEDSHNLKTFGAAYKPVNGPNCSQCGRQFNPEKLHSHMKYCRGVKSKAKSTNSRLEPNTRRSHSPSSKSMDTFFLANN